MSLAVAQHEEFRDAEVAALKQLLQDKRQLRQHLLKTSADEVREAEAKLLAREEHLLKQRGAAPAAAAAAPAKAPSKQSLKKEARRLAAALIKTSVVVMHEPAPEKEKEKEKGPEKDGDVQFRFPGIPRMRLQDCSKFVGQRVSVCGWAKFVRQQPRVVFIDVRSGETIQTLQATFSGSLLTDEIRELAREASFLIAGVVKEEKKATGGYEMTVDTFQLLGASDKKITTYYGDDAGAETLCDYRVLHLRRPIPSAIMRVRAALMQCLRDHAMSQGFTEVTPPCITPTHCEGGSDLFETDFFGKPAYLTQSSQPYLQMAVPALGRVFCCLPSFRKEPSKTRRHLAEYTHFEVEAPFCDFDELLEILESFAVDTSERLDRLAGHLARTVNPDFAPYKRGFLRLRYEDAITWLDAHKIEHPADKGKDTKTQWKFGDEIPEGPERQMIDAIGRPTFLTHFPKLHKPAYVRPSKQDPRVGLSVDLLLPGVGEIIGASCRVGTLAELKHEIAARKEKEEDYENDIFLLRHGSGHTAGFGAGVERLLTALLAQYHIRDACLFSRYIGRCTP